MTGEIYEELLDGKTMIEPDQVDGSAAGRGNSRRKTIIEDESPESSSNAFTPKQSQPEPKAESKSGTTQRFRPLIRPPVAKLFVLDDSGLDAEVIRIREETFRIGRESGDLILRHDSQMSSEHAEIRREFKEGRWHWVLMDLESTNGTFVRATEIPLEDTLEFWLGGRLYRFQLAEEGSSQQPSRESKGTMVAAAAFSAPTSAAMITEVTVNGDGKQYSLTGTGQWIGRDPKKCSIVIDDPMLGSVDSQIYCDSEGNWGNKEREVAEWSLGASSGRSVGRTGVAVSMWRATVCTESGLVLCVDKQCVDKQCVSSVQ